MKSYPPPPIPDSIIQSMQQLVDRGATQAQLIAAMRETGLSIIPSMKLLIRFYGLTHSEAKRTVHLSSTWSDCYQANEALHDAAFQAARQLGCEEDDAPKANPRLQAVR
jgi:hypothetical protein